MAGGFLAKATESLASAEADYAARRYNSCARNAYYAAFQAAVAALMDAGIRPRGGRWEHDYVHGEFQGRLVYRRKLYDARFRSLLSASLRRRNRADYTVIGMNDQHARTALREARALVAAVQEQIGGNS